ncbi:MAG: hypothetical protein A2Y62_03790 [Candidatus Fischerbacteria bacterium RBG_13_37_8]|uniref:MucB/RseB N-terminal domain-containing protein n=1 Tax=Candidatus Fischerbacteria bacterium RBG_13_37_8 TaxID=1817863 RepID=A0A1F5V8D7_9BACT|nr:MAG: hypothetical protein A2Y62_03790 [Candidatus Fischerbacteria bacterium RBG_13_37_8]
MNYRILISFVILMIISMALAFVIIKRTELQAETEKSNTETITPEYIISKLLEHNQVREHKMLGYSAEREYYAESGRFNKKASMRVKVVFESPRTKRFDIISEDGSKTIRNKIFHGLMEAELDALDPEKKRQSIISFNNYTFKLAGEADMLGYHCYLLDVEPKREEKYLFRGRVWIEANDFAVVRLEGSPAKRPSIWTRKVEFSRENQKVGDFWVPAKDESTTKIFIFGDSTYIVHYFNYQFQTRAAE